MTSVLGGRLLDAHIASDDSWPTIWLDHQALLLNISEFYLLFLYGLPHCEQLNGLSDTVYAGKEEDFPGLPQSLRRAKIAKPLWDSS